MLSNIPTNQKSNVIKTLQIPRVTRKTLKPIGLDSCSALLICQLLRKFTSFVVWRQLTLSNFIDDSGTNNLMVKCAIVFSDCVGQVQGQARLGKVSAPVGTLESHDRIWTVPNWARL